MAEENVEKAKVRDILQDLERGDIEEVEEHLAVMLAAARPAAELALTGAAAEGHKLFAQATCNQCHGDNGEGSFGPALAGRTQGQVFRQVRTPVGSMPAFPPDQVSDQDLEKIAAFIEALPTVPPLAEPLCADLTPRSGFGEVSASYPHLLLTLCSPVCAGAYHSFFLLGPF